jgi:hypothetical protein
MYFITLPVDKEEFKKKLTEVRSDETGWIKYFYDRNANKEWVEYYPYQEDRVPSILKRTDLTDNLESLMNTCLSSNDIEDWRGLGAELSSGKYDIKEIAQIFKSNKFNWSNSALKEFKKSFRPIDSRNIIGMKIDEVEKTYREFVNAKKEIDNIIQ